MTQAELYDFPIKRPKFIESASFDGDDKDLSLTLTYRDHLNSLKAISFRLHGEDEDGQMYLPTAKDVDYLAGLAEGRDTFVAHLRMCTMIGRHIPGSQEFRDFVVNHAEASNFQMSVGTVKLDASKTVHQPDQKCIHFVFKKGSGAPFETVVVDYLELVRYSFAPSTQLLTIPGALRKEFGYVHDFNAGNILTANERQNTLDFILCQGDYDPDTGSKEGLSPWV